MNQQNRGIVADRQGKYSLPSDSELAKHRQIAGVVRMPESFPEPLAEYVVQYRQTDALPKTDFDKFNLTGFRQRTRSASFRASVGGHSAMHRRRRSLYSWLYGTSTKTSTGGPMVFLEGV